MSKLTEMIKLMEASDNTRLCGAVNENCANDCHQCPFGSTENKEHVVNSLKVVDMMMGQSFAATEPKDN